MAEDEKPSRPESLPAELRSRIYRFAVVRDEPYDLTEKDARARLFDPALALVNKRIRAEVIPIFYGNNRFHFSVSAKPFEKFDPVK